MVIKPPLYCTRKWNCNLSCTSALSQLQLPCNGSTGQVPLPEYEISQGTPRTCTRCSSRKFHVPGGGPDQLNRCKEAATGSMLMCSSNCSFISWYNTMGVNHREAALESRSGKIATVSWHLRILLGQRRSHILNTPSQLPPDFLLGVHLDKVSRQFYMPVRALAPISSKALLICSLLPGVCSELCICICIYIRTCICV